MKGFVKVLDVDTNNSNLPILEAMEDYTLALIAAVGNNEMTDSQKWALNHFLIEIGAVDKSGIFLKLKTLLLPVIAKDVQGALYDLVTESSRYTSQSIIFNDHSIKNNTSSTINVFDVTAASHNLTNSSFLLCPRTTENTGIPFTTVGDTYASITNDMECAITPVVTYQKSIVISSTSYKNVRGISINGLNAENVVVYGNDGVRTTQLEATVKSDFRNISFDSLRIRLQTSNAISAIAFGSALTASEMQKLVSEVATLKSSFVS